MKESKKEKTEKGYKDAKAKWAREHTDLFLDILEKVGDETGVTIRPVQYVKAYKLCVEELKFGYPAEYRAAEIISTEETYEQTLEIMTAVMKRFRLDFHKKLEKQNSRGRKRVA